MEKIFRGNQPRSSLELEIWHSQCVREPALEPELEIIDTHHHLFDDPARGSCYLLPDLEADLGAGHNVAATVYVEAFSSMWRDHGPESMRPVGEVEFAAGIGAMVDSRTNRQCRVGAAIIAHADLMLGDRVACVLDGEIAAGRGRLRGIRYQLAHDPGLVGQYIRHKAPANAMKDRDFMRGIAQIAERGLHFEAWLFHHQLHDLASLARTFPEVTFVLNHIGGPIGVANYAQDRCSVIAKWRAGIEELASLGNTVVKIGGLGMPVFGFAFEQERRPASSSELVAAWGPLIQECIDRFGAQRCMFESNFPMDRQSCSYEALWNAFKLATASLSPDQRLALFSGTARRVYRI